VLAFGTLRVSPAKRVDMQTAQADIVNELRILRAAGNHKHITSYLGCAQRHGMLYVVMEWMAQGSLLAVLKRRSLTLKEVRDTGRDAMTCVGLRGSSHAGVCSQQLSFAIDAAAGLSHLHSRNIIHRYVSRFPHPQQGSIPC